MSAGNFHAERTELAKVLSSGIFERSPSLAQLLTYICAKYFEGEAESIKEYSIAVDALGRSPDFEQKKDSIVRVQMHRLRERLAEYYQTRGASNEMQIVISQGRYVPHFVRQDSQHVAGLPDSIDHDRSRSTAEETDHVPVRTSLEALSFSAVVVPTGSRRYWWLAGVAALITILVGVSWVESKRSGGIATAAPINADLAVQPAGETIRILSGLESGTFIDGFGHEWLNDRYFSGGSVVNVGDQLILGTREPRLYQSRRQGTFVYDIPLKAGVYEMRLHFAEMHFGELGLGGHGGEASRKFGIVVNGNTLAELDVVGEVGSRTSNVKVFRDISPAPDGMLHLSFTPLKSVPFLNAIELTPGVQGRLLPIRIVTQDRAYRDHHGREWLPDRYAIGGQLVKQNTNVAAADPKIFAGERFGNLKYVIPVPPGKYTLTLYWAERWAGPNLPGGAGVGARLFDILLNGVALARDFDVSARAGGPDRALVETFRGIEPNRQGKLELSLVPKQRFAMLNALEIIDENRQP